MKKLFILAVLCSFCFAFSYAQNEIVVDPNASVREISPMFNRIKISHNIKLVISQSSQVSLAISASEEKYKYQIKTEVSDNTLKIFAEGDNWSAAKNRQFTVYLSFKQLNRLEASGAVQVLISGPILENSLVINLSGASSIRGVLDVQTLTMELSGASKARLSGKANSFSVECSGASDVIAFELTAQSCNATASGASDIQVSAAKELNAIASGVSRIYYKGDARANVKQSGVSKIEKRN